MKLIPEKVNTAWNSRQEAIVFSTVDKKGSVKYYTSGEIYEDMKKWNPERLPGNAVAALEVEEVYSGSEKLV